MLRYFTFGHVRSQKIKRNIAFSFVLRGINVAIGLLLIPLVLDYLDETRYGIWLTLVSLVSWFEFFDLGLGHGLRNKLSEALTKNDNKLAEKYVSTAYCLLSLIAVIFLCLFLIINSFLSWTKILNTTDVPTKELNLLAIIVFSAFSANLILKLITNVFYALQKPAINDLIAAASKILNLSVIFLLLKTTKDSLLFLGLTYSIVPLAVLIIFSTIAFKGKFKFLKPQLRNIDFALIRDLMSLGSKFFVIQIASIIMYSTGNMIVIQLFSPAEVTPYQIAYRYFSTIMIGFGIIITPFWSAFTEAFIKRENDWINNIIRKLFKLWAGVLLVLFLMLIFSSKVYSVWLGNKISIPFALSAAWAFFIAIQALNSIFVHFINGTGLVRVQMLLGIFLALLNIPMSILLADQFKMGIVGVICAPIICQSVGLVASLIQYNMIIAGRINGIWGK